MGGMKGTADSGGSVMESLRRRIEHEEFDYVALMDCLKGYAHPRDKVTGLLRRGAVVRVKKGLYVFGEPYRRGPYSRELLANLIYGPSYISLSYALSYYGLIPERVETVTCVTSGKNRAFSTPVGRFTYRSVPEGCYRVGIDLVEIGDGRSCLMACREKALADFVCHDRGSGVRGAGDLERYLLDHVRVDPGELVKQDPGRLGAISGACRSRKVRLLFEIIRDLHPKKKETGRE
jgi:hypothetical protein